MGDVRARPRSRPIRGRFLQIVTALDRSETRYALSGDVAMRAHGQRRLFDAIEVLVDGADLARLLSRLRRSLREIAHEPPTGPPGRLTLRSRRALGPDSVDVDLAVATDPAEAWALATAVPATLYGRTARVVSPEALVVLKLRAYLRNPRAPGALGRRADALALLHHVPMNRVALRTFVSSHPELRDELARALTVTPYSGQ